MTSRAEYRQAFEAMLNDDAATAKQMTATQGEVTWRDSGLLVTAAFALAAEQRFAEDESHDAIKAFVREAEFNYEQSPTPIKPLIAEAVTRGVLGEEQLLNEVPREEQQTTQMMLTYKIVQDSEFSSDRITRLLDDAEALVDQWTATNL